MYVMLFVNNIFSITTYLCLLTNIYLPTSTYPYLIAAYPEAGIGLFTMECFGSFKNL